MRKSCGVMLLIPLISTGAIHAQKAMEGTISSVTVYPDRALVTRTAAFQMDAGVQEATITSLPANIDVSSVRVRAEGPEGLRITGLDLIKKYTSETVNQHVRDLEDRIQALTDQIQEKDQAIFLAQSEKEFYLSIKAKASADAQDKLTGSKTTLDDFQSVAQFAFNGLKSAVQTERQKELEKREIQKEIQKLQNELGSMRNTPSREFYEAVIGLKGVTPGKCAMELDYQLTGAAWRPVYDARFDPETEKVEWTYAAMVTQRTGEKWENVALTLSTARPDLGAGPPEMTPWILNVWEAMKKARGFMMPQAAAPATSELMMDSDAEPMEMEEKAAAMPEMAAVDSSGMSVQFKIVSKASIPGDGTMKRVTIVVHEFGSELSYHAVPKFSEFAYLTARIKNDTETPFLAGELRAFAGNALAGAWNIEAVSPGEEFDLPLGADDRIKIKRTIVHQDRDKSGLFTSKIRWNYEYGTEIECFTRRSVSLKLQDQVPLSRDSRVTVMEIRATPKFDSKDDEGIVEWKLTLEPGKKQQVQFGFMIEYPADLSVSGL